MNSNADNHALAWRRLAVTMLAPMLTLTLAGCGEVATAPVADLNANPEKNENGIATTCSGTDDDDYQECKMALHDGRIVTCIKSREKYNSDGLGIGLSCDWEHVEQPGVTD